jgi:hypothetical protein
VDCAAVSLRRSAIIRFAGELQSSSTASMPSALPSVLVDSFVSPLLASVCGEDDPSTGDPVCCAFAAVRAAASASRPFTFRASSIRSAMTRARCAASSSANLVASVPSVSTGFLRPTCPCACMACTSTRASCKIRIAVCSSASSAGSTQPRRGCPAAAATATPGTSANRRGRSAPPLGRSAARPRRPVVGTLPTRPEVARMSRPAACRRTRNRDGGPRADGDAKLESATAARWLSSRPARCARLPAPRPAAAVERTGDRPARLRGSIGGGPTAARVTARRSAVFPAWRHSSWRDAIVVQSSAQPHPWRSPRRCGRSGTRSGGTKPLSEDTSGHHAIGNPQRPHCPSLI